jgi:hypothetical protein
MRQVLLSILVLFYWVACAQCADVEDKDQVITAKDGTRDEALARKKADVTFKSVGYNESAEYELKVIPQAGRKFKAGTAEVEVVAKISSTNWTNPVDTELVAKYEGHLKNNKDSHYVKAYIVLFYGKQKPKTGEGGNGNGDETIPPWALKGQYKNEGANTYELDLVRPCTVENTLDEKGVKYTAKWRNSNDITVEEFCGANVLRKRGANLSIRNLFLNTPADKQHTFYVYKPAGEDYDVGPAQPLRTFTIIAEGKVIDPDDPALYFAESTLAVSNVRPVLKVCQTISPSSPWQVGPIFNEDKAIAKILEVIFTDLEDSKMIGKLSIKITGMWLKAPGERSRSNNGKKKNWKVRESTSEDGKLAYNLQQTKTDELIVPSDGAIYDLLKINFQISGFQDIKDAAGNQAIVIDSDGDEMNNNLYSGTVVIKFEMEKP